METEKVEYTVGMFNEALKEFTSWAQVLNYFQNQPQAIRDETYAKIEADINRHTQNRDGEAQRVIVLEARLQELKTAAGD